MKIAIIALGSRGDVQPYIALGKGLQAAGHGVRLITHENYEKLVNAHGLEFWPVHGNIQEFAESPEMRALLEKGNFLAIMSYAAKAAKVAALNWAKEGLAACQGVDLIVGGFGGMFVGLALAEKLGLPLVQAHYVPFTPTREFPGALFPQSVARLGGAANRLSHHLTRQMMWQQGRDADAAARQQVLGLPAAPFFGPYHAEPLQRTPILYGFSPSVIAKPADWGENTHITGYWFLNSESSWNPPPALEEFLQRGPAPLYIGFGSMSSRKPEETAQLILQALAQTGQRAILLSGWNGMQAEKLPENVLVVDSIPHDWLFSRMAAVVHHGGAGTTAAGLRAGVPSVIIPFFGDQPFWGQRVAELGVGPQPIPRQKLTVERLAQAIQQAVTDPAIRQRAAALGAKIRAEDGIGRAVAIFQKL
jgi:UDP:flavonoid glycosyltransferase YjiC (YdhE family)